MKMEELYSKILSILEGEVEATSFNTWFSKVKPVYFDEDKSFMRIKVPLMIHKTILKERYNKLIDDAVEQVYGKSLTFEYVTEDEINTIEEVEETKEEPNNIITLNEEWDSNLKPEYTFDNFVQGDSNKLAYFTAQTLAKNFIDNKTAKGSNPLFIYGRSGVGKTHLMQAIGNYIVNNSDLKVLYTTSGDFKREYVEIFNEKNNDTINNAQKFKNKYQNLDVLIVDDIQYLVGANQTQQEFFHTFNALFQKDKQIILSSDKSPDDLKQIEDRLRSRFMQGLTVDIYPPELQLRCKIIKNKIKGKEIENMLSEEVIEYIANACTTDVRQIEGAINKLMIDYTLFRPEKIDISFTNEALKNYLKFNIFAENTVEKIQRVVAEYYNIEVSDLKSKKRTATIAKARQIAMYICRAQTDEVLERIGLEFGKDHSTVSAAYEKIKSDLKEDVKLNTVIKELISKL